MQFEVRYFDRSTGQVGSAVLEAATDVAAREQVMADGRTVLQVRQLRAGLLRPRARRLDLGVFCAELRTLLEAGLSVVEAVDTLAEKGTDGSGAVYTRLGEALRQGKSLAAAMAMQPDSFPGILVAAVKSAEMTGAVSRALLEFGRYHLMVSGLRDRAVSSAIYPAVVLGFGLIVSLFLLFFVVPRFASIYDVVGSSGSLATQVLIGLASHMKHYGWAWLTMTVMGIAALIVALRNGALARAAWRLASSIGPLRRVLRVFQLAQIFRSLAMLTRGGFTLLDGLKLSHALALEPTLNGSLLRVRERVEQGEGLAKALANEGVRDPVADRLIAAGERSGAMASIFDAIADDFGARVERTVERAMKIAEPMLMVLVGGFIGALVLLMYMPIFDLTQSLNR